MRKIVLYFLFFIIPLCLISQELDYGEQYQQLQPGGPARPEAAQEEELVEAQINRLQLAISNENYPVTPGDIYRITFTTAGELVSNQLIVESDYSINLGVFGTMDVKNMRFPVLKKQVEELILQGYPGSLPSLTMISTGNFVIPVIGEIPQTRYITAWGLTRLDEAVATVLGRYSSLRNIRVISMDGVAREYDLWMARYRGDLSQNPLIRPGDRIDIGRVKKEIYINGEVYRPGRYQLKQEENFESVRLFTGGFTPLADLRRITIERYSGEQVELILLDYNEYKESFEFHDRDVITVPSKRDEDLQVTVLGAVFSPGRYAYTPPEHYMYYVNLAGGIDFERNSREEVTILDRYGNEKNTNLPVMPGDTITVLNNDFVYNFNRYFPVVTTGFAFIITIIEIVNLANQ